MCDVAILRFEMLAEEFRSGRTSVPALQVVEAGTVAYAKALALQQALHSAVVAGRVPPTLMMVQHPPVITLGLNSDKAHLHLATDDLKSRGVDVHATDRGGEVTAHEPGQLVVYPVLQLPAFHLTPKRYIRCLEESVIEVLEEYSLKAVVDPDHPGVWVGKDKICAIGVRIKDRVTMHGLALNVSNSLELFHYMTPCGIIGRGVTSVAKLTGTMVSPDAVGHLLAQALARRLGTTLKGGAIRLEPSLQWAGGVFTL